MCGAGVMRQLVFMLASVGPGWKMEFKKERRQNGGLGENASPTLLRVNRVFGLVLLVSGCIVGFNYQ
jgi:hypothetical protein